MNEQLTFLFVHGLSGWGSYDKANRRMPYWGMRGGDLTVWLRQRGCACYAASVAPKGSAWDRACELYAQLSGTKTDYGAAHSREMKHPRFGRDFSGCPLIPEWNDRLRLVLLGHSFGGATVRLFAELMANGDPREREAAAPEDLSPLFRGGMGAMIHSVVALAAPMNGTTAYDLFRDAAFDPGAVKTPWWSGPLAWAMSRGTSPQQDGRDPRDYADYDMHLDHALALNRRISTLPGTYYFSVPCSYTDRQPDGTWLPRRGMEPLFAARARQIGAYRGKTAGGMPVDERWRENDGLVNTISAKVPTGAPWKPLDRDRIEAGVWNVFPTVSGDHMWPQGGLLHRHDVRAFYLELLELIRKL